MEDFYELELNVKGLKSLDASLDEYLTIEELNGDNQYFCESCKGRVDATRSIKLRTLPRVLNFQLKRYVFLPKVLIDYIINFHVFIIIANIVQPWISFLIFYLLLFCFIVVFEAYKRP